MYVYFILTFFYVLFITENGTKVWPLQPENMTPRVDPKTPCIYIFGRGEAFCAIYTS